MGEVSENGVFSESGLGFGIWPFPAPRLVLRWPMFSSFWVNL